MARERFGCPHCEVVASQRHNFIRHLTATHGVGLTDAEQCAIDRVQLGEAATVPHSASVFVTSGHLRSLSMLEDAIQATSTVSAFRDALGELTYSSALSTAG